MQLLGPAPTQEIWCGDLHFNKLTWSWEWTLRFENLCVNYSGSSSISALTPTFSHLPDWLFLLLNSLTPNFSFFHFLPTFPRWGLYDLGLDSYAGLLYCQSVLTLRPAQFFCSTDVMWSLLHHLHWILMAYWIKPRCHLTSTPFQFQLLQSFLYAYHSAN